jgi:hypothetical protein
VPAGDCCAPLPAPLHVAPATGSLPEIMWSWPLSGLEIPLAPLLDHITGRAGGDWRGVLGLLIIRVFMIFKS